MFGRIATTLFVVYPPGIASIVPASGSDERTAADAGLSQNLRAQRQSVPGVRGGDPGHLRETEPDGSVRFYTYVVRE